MISFYSFETTPSELIVAHRWLLLPVVDEVRIVVRRNHLLKVLFTMLRMVLDLTKRLQLISGRASGGYRRASGRVLASSTHICGSTISRTRNHNVVELNRKTFYYVGVFIALYILHGGPAPKLFSSAIADNNYCLWHTEGQSRNR